MKKKKNGTAKAPAQETPSITETSELKIERLELLSMAQDLENISTKLSAFQTKISQLQAEANLTNRAIQDLNQQGQNLYGQYQARYVALKERFGVPADKELNLRTGEFVDKPAEAEATAPQ